MKLKDQERNAGIHIGLGNCYYELELYDEALSYYMTAKSLYIKLYGRNDFRVAGVLNNIGLVQISINEFKRAKLTF